MHCRCSAGFSKGAVADALQWLKISYICCTARRNCAENFYDVRFQQHLPPCVVRPDDFGASCRPDGNRWRHAYPLSERHSEQECKSLWVLSCVLKGFIGNRNRYQGLCRWIGCFLIADFAPDSISILYRRNFIEKWAWPDWQAPLMPMTGLGASARLSRSLIPSLTTK